MYPTTHNLQEIVEEPVNNIEGCSLVPYSDSSSGEESDIDSSADLSDSDSDSLSSTEDSGADSVTNPEKAANRFKTAEMPSVPAATAEEEEEAEKAANRFKAAKMPSVPAATAEEEEAAEMVDASGVEEQGAKEVWAVGWPAD